MGPEGANVDPQHLWRVDHLAQGPHECTVDPHQLLRVHLVSLVKHHSNLVILAPERLNGLWKLIRYIQLMGIKKEDDSVNSLSKPLEDLAEVIAWRKNTLLQSYHSEKVSLGEGRAGDREQEDNSLYLGAKRKFITQEDSICRQQSQDSCVLHFLGPVSLLSPFVFITALFFCLTPTFASSQESGSSTTPK